MRVPVLPSITSYEQSRLALVTEMLKKKKMNLQKRKLAAGCIWFNSIGLFVKNHFFVFLFFFYRFNKTAVHTRVRGKRGVEGAFVARETATKKTNSFSNATCDYYPRLRGLLISFFFHSVKLLKILNFFFLRLKYSKKIRLYRIHLGRVTF